MSGFPEKAYFLDGPLKGTTARWKGDDFLALLPNRQTAYYIVDTKYPRGIVGYMKIGRNSPWQFIQAARRAIT